MKESTSDGTQPGTAVTPTLSIVCDYENRTLRVFCYVTPIPGFHGNWEEAAAYTSAEAWDKSPYAALVMSDDCLAAVTYFWMDMAESANQTA